VLINLVTLSAQCSDKQKYDSYSLDFKKMVFKDVIKRNLFIALNK